jgi:DNA polymerase-4
MDRVILHCDANSFYASCELVYRPALRGLPLAVCGSTEERHGIVLAATREAKKHGVKTAMVNWEARSVCPELIVVPPDYHLYIHFSQRLRHLYNEYTDRVEPFGLDECWLDISGRGIGLDDGVALASKLRYRAKEELGLTLSVGVSYNKVYAKLGSDMRKPDATTVISRVNYKDVAWPCPVDDMIGVGSRMLKKMKSRCIKTIGDLAVQSPEYMQVWLGKMGVILQRFAAGEDQTPVMRSHENSPIKSVGNSITAPRDMETLADVTCVLYIIADSVGARLREIGLRGKCISLMIRDSMLHCFGGQKTVDFYTNHAEEIVPVAMNILFTKGYNTILPFRSIGLSVGTLEPDTQPVQMDLFGQAKKREQLNQLHQAIDGIRSRFGERAIERGTSLANPVFNAIIPKTDHVIHPVGFLR